MAAYATIEVICIRSLSYTGTSWLNAVIGCHPQVFAIGAPDRVWDLRTRGFEKACIVHGADCGFWGAFAETYDPGDNFFVQVAAAAGVDRLVINNPLPAGAGTQLDDPRLCVRPIQLVRDGRAIAQSYTRNVAGKDYLDAIQWLASALAGLPADPHDPDTLFLRHEDVDADRRGQLARIWTYLDLPPSPDAARFWEHELHLTAANRSIAWQIRLAKGLALPDDPNADFYRARFAAMCRDPDTPLADDRWRSELSERELFLFDLFCGAHNAALGYARDRFDLGCVGRYLTELSDAVVGNAIALQAYPSASDGARRLAPLTMLGRETGSAGAPRSVSLRQQLTMDNLKAHGLHLTPAMLSRLYRLGKTAAIGGAVIAVALVALVFAT